MLHRKLYNLEFFQKVIFSETIYVASASKYIIYLTNHNTVPRFPAMIQAPNCLPTKKNPNLGLLCMTHQHIQMKPNEKPVFLHICTASLFWEKESSLDLPVNNDGGSLGNVRNHGLHKLIPDYYTPRRVTLRRGSTYDSLNPFQLLDHTIFQVTVNMFTNLFFEHFQTTLVILKTRLF